jgi:DNA repair exonuclease SbcCD ATPase subunit
VQKVEGDLAAMLKEAEMEIQGRWQEFQKRCRTQEEKFDQERRGIGQQKAELEQARQTWLTEKENFMHNRIASNGTAVHQDEQHQALSLAEAALREQRTELAKMIGELKSLQGSIRRQQSGDVQALLEENQQLRDMVGELERRLALQVELAQSTPPAPGAPDAHVEPLLEENQMLRQLLEEKSHAVGELEERLRSAPVPKVTAKVQANDQDLENFEAELNQFRRQLENDRTRFDQECEQFRERQAELDEATKEMEMAMSRERAELARERIRLDRLREEVKNELERMQRDAGVMQSLAPVQRLREQLNQRARQ